MIRYALDFDANTIVDMHTREIVGCITHWQVEDRGRGIDVQINLRVVGAGYWRPYDPPPEPEALPQSPLEAFVVAQKAIAHEK